MLIRIVYQNQRYDFIKASRLDEFIETGAIASFQRRGVWVRVGIDPIRGQTTGSTYRGEERRRSQGMLADAA